MLDRSGTGVARRELLALALLAALPVLPYLVFALRTGVPRFCIAGDFALLEQATWHAWRGDALLGAYSRFRWHHPGPLFFYLAAPFEALFAPASTGLFVGACAVNALAASSLVLLLRIAGTRAHAVAGLLGVLAWFAAFGNATPNPWNPLVITVPLMAFLVAIALIAKGDARGVVPAALFGSLALLSHVATVTTVIGCGVVGALGFAIVRRRTAFIRADRLHLAGGLIVVALAALPPVIEQLSVPEGNIGALVRFFLHRDEPLKPVTTAFRNLLLASSSMPDRLLERALAEEGWLAYGMRWDPMPIRLSRTACTIAAVHVGAVLVGALVAVRRRDMLSVALLGIGVLSQLVAGASLRSVVGEDLHYLVFWTTATSGVTWIAAFASIFAGLAAWLRARAAMRVARPILERAALVAVTLGAAAATSLQAGWLERNPGLGGSYLSLRPTMQALHDALGARLEREDRTAVVHLEGAYDLAQAMVLELEKDGLDVRVLESERWIFTGVRSDAGLARPLHVWFSKPDLPLAKAACLEQLEERDGAAMYVATVDPPSCPPPVP